MFTIFRILLSRGFYYIKTQTHEGGGLVLPLPASVSVSHFLFIFKIFHNHILYEMRRRSVRSNRRFRRSSFKRPRRMAKKTGRKTSASFIRTVAKQVIARQEEKKQVYAVGVNNAIATAVSANANQPATFGLLPAIVQGTSQAQRVGNEVQLKKHTIKIIFNNLAYHATTNPTPYQFVIVWIVSYKLQAQNINLNYGNFLDFFQSGSTTVGFQGNMYDAILPVNQDIWTLHHKRIIKLGPASASIGAPSGSFAANNEAVASYTLKMELSKYAKGLLKYNDNASSPTNRSLWMIVQPIAYDGTGQTSTIVPIECHLSYDAWYTDA